MEGSHLRIILTLIIILFLFQGKSNAWEKVKEKNGITVYTRKREGSGFKEFKAVMLIRTSLSSLIALVDDIEASPLWIDTCKEGTLLRRVSPKETYTYTVNDAPWPVRDRDAVVHNIIEQDPQSGVVTIRTTAVPDYIPEKPDLVRVKKIDAYWRFTPLGDGLVELVYNVYNDPGGNLPAWLVNSAAISQPYNTLINLKEIIK